MQMSEAISYIRGDYAGDLLPQEVWEILQSDPDATLIDVRTEVETLFIGEPELTKIGKKTMLIQWVLYPSYEVNSDFIHQLYKVSPSKSTKLFFICTAGSRSKSAAITATKVGYSHSYSVANGFEGGLNFAGHRGTIDGWKAANLPWSQV